MIEVRLMTTRRLALTTSAPRPKASLTTPSTAKRNRATAKEPMVRTRRAFLRNRLARMSLLNFMTRLPQVRRDVLRLQPGRPCRDGEWFEPGGQLRGRG